MPLPSGTRLGRYEVRSQLGAGGMGELHLARNTTRFLVTEIVEGETLRQMMTRERPTLREALDVAVQIAAALVAAHKAGVAHRDVKPENVTVRRDGILKVWTSAWRKLLGGPEANSPPTRRSRPSPTPAPARPWARSSYMSPEQARGLPVDERTDIWSLAVVLYEMASGRPQFEGKTATEVLPIILHREPPSLLLRRPGKCPPSCSGG